MSAPKEYTPVAGPQHMHLRSLALALRVQLSHPPALMHPDHLVMSFTRKDAAQILRELEAVLT